MASKFCHECGAALVDGAKFCAACGSSVSGSALAAPPANLAPSPAPNEEIQERVVSDALGSVSQLTTEGASESLGDDDTVSNSVSQWGVRLGAVLTLLKHPAAYFAAYVVIMLPTYVLPYLGSNSSIMNANAAVGGPGTMPQFWLHVTALYLLVSIAWLRGGLIGRSWLPVLPALAAFFDMMPGFNWIPMIPTWFHIAALIAGVTKEAPAGLDIAPQIGRPRLVLIGLAAFIVMTVFRFASYSGEIEDARARLTGSPGAFEPSSYKDIFLSSEIELVTVTSAAKMRNYPTTNGTIIKRTYPPGEVLQGQWVQGVDPSTKWFNVRYPFGTHGYVWEGNLGSSERNTDSGDAGTSSFTRNWHMFARRLVNEKAVDEAVDNKYYGSPSQIIFSFNFSNGNIGDRFRCEITRVGMPPVNAEWTSKYTSGDAWCQFPQVYEGSYQLQLFVNGIPNAQATFEVVQ